MRTITLPIAIVILALLGGGGSVLAQDKAPPPAQGQVESLKKQHSGPPVDRSESDQAGKQEPSAKISNTNARPEPFWNGALTVAGAPADVDTIPSLRSQRTATDDKLPIAAYTLRHLTGEQKSALHRQLASQQPAPGVSGPAHYAVVGGEIPSDVALNGLQPLPQDIVSKMPELRGVAYTLAANKLLLVDADSRMVIGVL
jgi:hypothetical protein